MAAAWAVMAYAAMHTAGVCLRHTWGSKVDAWLGSRLTGIRCFLAAGNRSDHSQDSMGGCVVGLRGPADRFISTLGALAAAAVAAVHDCCCAAVWLSWQKQ